jgi:hypothetical protein
MIAQIFGGVPGQSSAPSVTDTLDEAFKSHRGAQTRAVVTQTAPKKKAKGMSREVYNLLGSNASLAPMVRWLGCASLLLADGGWVLVAGSGACGTAADEGINQGFFVVRAHAAVA